MTLGTYLRGLDPRELADLVARRPDVLVEPVPRDVDELADRLCGISSLSAALQGMDADELAVVRRLALAGPVPAGCLAAGFDSPATLVAEAVERLAARALCWPDGARLVLPERLAEHLVADLAAFPPVVELVRSVRVNDVRDAVRALGGDPSGTKAVVGGRLVALMSDAEVVGAAVAGLDVGSAHYLRVLVEAGGILFGGRGPEAGLRAAGLAVGGLHGAGAVPREVAAHVALGGPASLAGCPDVRASPAPGVDGRAAAEAAVRAVTSLLDLAAAAPLAALKRGGIGTRERKRLAGRIGALDPAIAIDVADELGLLDETADGYEPSTLFPVWRDEPVAVRWSDAARAWWALMISPTARTTEDGEVSPPVPMISSHGLIRRAVLSAAAGGRSLAAVGAAVEWFCPLHGLPDEMLAEAVATVLAEAEALGVVAGDRLTELGERLVARHADDDLEVDDLLPEVGGSVVLQSDLSVIVSGQASAAAMRVLTAAAAPEGQGAAVTWRFSPATIRAALDAGWTAERLRSALTDASGRDLPQPLDYLIGDVARRHGTVRVRETRCCLTGTEAEMAEILHTRKLARLELRCLAPTVLASPAAPGAVLAALRGAGFAPMPEDMDGVVVVSGAVAEHEPLDVPEDGHRITARRSVPPAEMIAQVLAAPAGDAGSQTRSRISELNPALDSAEVAYLADALDHGRVVTIRYRNSAGNPSMRDIAPIELWDRHLRSHCFLRGAEREFAVAGIESVSPA